jgi:hypothetical protein
MSSFFRNCLLATAWASIRTHKVEMIGCQLQVICSAVPGALSRSTGEPVLNVSGF